MIDCIVRDNETDNHGAGVYVEDGAGATIEGCLFEDNHIIDNQTISRHGGGVHVESIDGSTIDRCRFISNSCTGYGGGLFLGRENQDAGVVDAFPQVRSCLFVGNEAGFNGGGAYVEPALSGCKNPVAIGYVTNCTFIGNSSPRAGAIWGNNRNWCGVSLGLESPSCLVFNSILWRNGPDWPSEYKPAGFRRCVIDHLTSRAADALQCSNLNPRFLDEQGADGIAWNGDGDYRVLPGSVCIDSGFESLLGVTLDVGSLDVAGMNRIIDDPHSANIGSSALDIGAHEASDADLSFDLAFWTGGGDSLQLLDPTNWYMGLLPSPNRGLIFDGTAGVGLNIDASISMVALYSGSLVFAPGASGQITLGDKSGLESLYMGLMGEVANLGLAESIELECHGIENTRGRLSLNGATVSVETQVELLQVDESETSAGEDGINIGILNGPGTIRRINDTSSPGDPLDPVLTNNGRIRVDGLIDVQGDYLQEGGILRFQHRASDGFGNDRRVEVDGMASIGGSVVFDVGIGAWDPPVGSTFEIFSATEGFEVGRDSFDFAVTQWYGDSRFFICSTVENVGGSGSSVMATVATIDSLVSADPALANIGIALQDMLLVDVDGDEAEDLVLSVDTGEGSNGQLVVLLNAGSDAQGTWNGFEDFASAYAITVGEGPRGLDAGFIDVGSAEGGANYDLLVANENSGTVSVIQNNSVIGSVDLAIIQTVQIGESSENIFPTDVCALNLDGDPQGYSDMLVACATGVVWSYQNVTAFQGFGGMDSPSESKPDETINQFDPGLGGGGGVRDTGPAGRSSSGSTVEIGRIESLLGPGGIQMTWQSYGLPPGSEPSDIGMADLDQDGFEDVVTSNRNDASISIMLGSGVGAFLEPITIPLELEYVETESIAIGDIDGDEDLDIVLICLGPEVDPLLGQQKVLRIVRNTLNDGGFGWVFDVEESLRGLAPYLVRAADVDDDGVDDIIALTEGGSAFNGPGFGLATLVIPPEIPDCLGDLNDDGVVNGADLGLLIAGWGPCLSEPCVGDLNDDGTVNGADLGLMIAAWGPCQAADGGS